MKRIIFMLSAIIIFNMLFHCDNIFAANKLLSGKKVISVPDVSLISGVSFLVRKSPRHRPKNWLNQGKPI